MLTLDYKKIFNDGTSAERLANIFLNDYYGETGITFPVNPFQMLTDLGIPFVFRPFKNYEGVYILGSEEDDVPIIGINLNRPIVRQRFTAAHELCHHLKDVDSGFTCTSNPQSEIELYADAFASELLMPMKEFRKQVNFHLNNGYLDFDGVLEVANYFGVSFQACLYKVAYKLHLIEGDTSPKILRSKTNKYKPQTKRKEKSLFYTNLYEQLFNAFGKNFQVVPTANTCQKFKTEYVFYDSRMEGVNIDGETVGDIVTDLTIRKQNSQFCKEENKNIVEVAGLTLAYDYAFDKANTDISVYDAKHINEKLFSTAPYPEFGGKYRESNTLVLGAKFDTVDFNKIQEEMFNLDKDIASLMDNYNNMSYSDYVESIVRIHHRLTVIHAFRDGNGRTSRAFCNMMLLKRHISPVFFKNKSKDEYKDALAIADLTGEYDALYEVFFKSILESSAALSDFLN